MEIVNFKTQNMFLMWLEDSKQKLNPLSFLIDSPLNERVFSYLIEYMHHKNKTSMCNSLVFDILDIESKRGFKFHDIE